LLLLVTVVLAGLLVIRPGAQRLRGQIAGSISSAVGRPVEIGSVSIHLLPQPGFDLGSFVVHDDPNFSAEPMLRSDDVTAALRVSSLFRGRLEIARLSLSEPSVNLVRDGNGHWNLENLLERAARTPIAPTGKTTNETRPAFPYIEADHGRINFKFGPEKKPYALTDCGFSFWQDSENAWGMRLKAQPVRTDSNLSDTGLLRVNGTWQRATTLRQTPLQFSLEWDRAQLGQLTKLILGNDKGWRGSVILSSTLTGTPADLRIHTEASITDFRRYDVVSGGSLRLAAECDGRYNAADRVFSDILCNAPVGAGTLSLNGTLGIVPGAISYRMAASAQDVPAQALSTLFRHLKKDVPEDLTAAGSLTGS
jgi:AsmA protein